MLRLVSDEDVHEDILRGLRRREPSLDLVRAVDVGLEQTPENNAVGASQAETHFMNTARSATARAGARPSPQYPHSGVAMLALLAGIAMTPEASAQQAWTDETFERWVFQQDCSAAGARTWLNSELSSHVNQIDRACRL